MFTVRIYPHTHDPNDVMANTKAFKPLIEVSGAFTAAFRRWSIWVSFTNGDQAATFIANCAKNVAKHPEMDFRVEMTHEVVEDEE